MKELKKYKTQIFNVITILLIVTFVIFPGLNESNTILNLMAGIGLLLLLFWGVLALYHYVMSKDDGLVEVKEVEKKPNPKQFDGVKSEEPFTKTRKKSTTKKTK
jgi:hypothetical protein